MASISPQCYQGCILLWTIKEQTSYNRVDIKNCSPSKVYMKEEANHNKIEYVARVLKHLASSNSIEIRKPFSLLVSCIGEKSSQIA